MFAGSLHADAYRCIVHLATQDVVFERQSRSAQHTKGVARHAERSVCCECQTNRICIPATCPGRRVCCPLTWLRAHLTETSHICGLVFSFGVIFVKAVRVVNRSPVYPKETHYDHHTRDVDQHFSLEDGPLERQHSKSRTQPVTIRLRRDLYAQLPVEPVYYAGVRGVGKAGYLSEVLEQALIEKLGLATAEVDAQAA